MQKLAGRRDLEDLSAEPLGDIQVALMVDLHAVRSQPPGIYLVRRQKVQQREIRSALERAICIDAELQYAIPNRFADVEGLLVGRNADTVGIVQIPRHLDPLLTAGRQIENLSGDRCRHVLGRTKHRRVGTAIGGDDDVVDAAVESVALIVAVPAVQKLARQVELQNRAMAVRAGKQKSS